MKRALVILLSVFFPFLSGAQTPCDSLDLSVKYSAFTDTLIEVSVINHSQAFYSYPGFIIQKPNADTVAIENVVLFGLGPSSQHLLSVDSAMLTSPTFPGTLKLYSGFYANLECSYNLNFNLCLDSCVMAYPCMVNMGGAMSSGTVNWTLQNAMSQTVASGDFTLGGSQQMDEDTLCLIPGQYSLNVAAITAPMGGQPYFGITTHLSGAPEPLKQYLITAVQLPFSFYKNCVTTSLAEVSATTQRVNIFSYNGLVNLRNTTGKPIGDVIIYSVIGQPVWFGRISSAEQVIDLSYLSSGMYIVKAQSAGSVESQKVFIGK
jgi:hypothetical protein